VENAGDINSQPEHGVLPQSWYTPGEPRDGSPDFLVHAYNNDFYILRQSAHTHFEKPFLYLIFGRDRAILFDTGAGNVDVAGVVRSVVREWLLRNGREHIALIVTHTHNHNDHIAGDEQFANREGVTLVKADAASVSAFYGFTNWPNENVTIDLGDRVLDLIPIPGHEASSFAIYDRRTQVMITSDTFYPGRLYVRDGAAFAASIRRLVDFSACHHVVHFLGTHIEQSSVPFVDYPEGTVDQSNEHVLQLSRAQLLELNDALTAMNGKVVRYALPSLTVWPV
jgi:hydroxyacylglutathione hydrolase